MVRLDDPNVRAALDDDELPRMTFGDHLDELRRRLIYSLLAVFAAVLLVMPFKQTVEGIIIEPYRVQWRIGFENWVDKLQQRGAAGTLDGQGKEFLAFCLEYREAILAGDYEWASHIPLKSGYPVPYTLFAGNGLEDILAFMWASLIFALVLASPVVVWQVWAFIAAGLYKHERAVFYRYFPFMVGLAAAGVWFGYRLALPYTLGFLIGLMDPGTVHAIFGIGSFLSLLFMTTAAMGLMFQLPLVMLALQTVGLVKHEAFRKHWRATILVIAVVAAVFTPPDPVSMLFMMAPMILLYAIGLLLTGTAARRRARATVTGTVGADA